MTDEPFKRSSDLPPHEQRKAIELAIGKAMAEYFEKHPDLVEQGIDRWMDRKIAQFGRWSLMAILAAGFAWVMTQIYGKG